MKFRIILPLIAGFTLYLGLTVQAQYATLPQFLKDKQVWEEKLVVIYASQDQQHLVKEQLDALYPYITTFKKEKIVVVQLPSRLSAANKNYLSQKLHYHKDRLNIWVFDEKGTLRLSSTKPTSAEHFLRVLDVETRTNAVAKAQFFRD